MIVTNSPAQAVQNEKDLKKPSLADSKKGLFAKQTLSRDQVSEIDRKLQNLTNKLLDSLQAGKTTANLRTINEASNTKVAPNLLKDIKDLTKTIQNEPKLQEIASKLEEFLKPVETMKSSTMAQNIKNSGILLEAKISETLQNSEFPVKIKELISLMKNTNSQSLKEAFLTLPNDDNIEKNLSDLNKLLDSHKSENLKIINKSPFKSLLELSSKLENIAKFIDKSLNNLDAKTASKIIDLLDTKLEQSAKMLNSLDLNDPSLRHAKFLRNQIGQILNDLSADIKFIKGQSAEKGMLFQNNRPQLNSGQNQANLSTQPNLANNPQTTQNPSVSPNLNQPNAQPNTQANVQVNLNEPNLTQNQSNLTQNQANSQPNLNTNATNQTAQPNQAQPNLANNPQTTQNTSVSPNLNQPNAQPNAQANVQPNAQANVQVNLNEPNLTQNQSNLAQNQANSQPNLNTNIANQTAQPNQAQPNAQANLIFTPSPKVLPQNINLSNFTELGSMQPNSVNLQNKLINLSHKITNIINAMEPDTITAKNTLGEIKSLFRVSGLAKNQISQIIQTSFESNAKNLQNDLKSVLLNLKELTSKDANLRGVNQTTNRLITQIEINQLISYTQNSLQTHLPYTWDALDSSSVAFKRGQKDKFYARIELNFVKHGSVSVMIGLFDLKYIDVSITTSQKDFKDTILKHAKDLKRALNSQGLIVNSFYLSQKSDKEPYHKHDAVMDLGYNIKA